MNTGYHFLTSESYPLMEIHNILIWAKYWIVSLCKEILENTCITSELSLFNIKMQSTQGNTEHNNIMGRNWPFHIYLKQLTQRPSASISWLTYQIFNILLRSPTQPRTISWEIIKFQERADKITGTMIFIFT